MNTTKNQDRKKIGILLSGCGVYDGAEIQESVLCMLAIEEMNWEVVCLSVNAPQHHVIDHSTGEEMLGESRNMLVEASRIARGKITDISHLDTSSLDALVIPGGFGSAKNFSDWAFKGVDSQIKYPEIKTLIHTMHATKKPIVALCVSPIIVAKTFEKTTIQPLLTIGTTEEQSPYSIADFVQGLETTGAKTSLKTTQEIQIDPINKIITAPCYMMEASLLEVRANIRQAIEAIQTFDSL